MNTIGPILSVPWGPLIITVIGILILIVISEICWKKMPHYPEDDEPWDMEDPFRVKYEDWSKK